MSKFIDAKQVRLIHIAKGSLGLSEAEYHDILMRHCRNPYLPGGLEPTSKALSYAEASAVIDHMRSLGVRFPRRAGSSGRAKREPRMGRSVEMMVSQRQNARIAELLTSIEGIRTTPEQYLSGICKRLLRGKPRPSTADEASLIIEALKGVIKRQEGMP